VSEKVSGTPGCGQGKTGEVDLRQLHSLLPRKRPSHIDERSKRPYLVVIDVGQNHLEDVLELDLLRS